jgi:mono/diheme cytochrome c family protein
MNKLVILLLFSIAFEGYNLASEKKDSYTIIQNTTSHIRQNELEKSILRGEDIYQDFCRECHRSKGKGFGNKYPPLAGSDFLMNYRTQSIRIVKYGRQGEIVVNGKTYNNLMEPLGLENDEISDVMNYIMNSWDNTQDKMVTPEEVTAVEK